MREERFEPFFNVIDTYMLKGHLVIVSDRFDSGAARTNEIIQVHTPCGGKPKQYSAGCISVSGGHYPLVNHFCMAVKGAEPEEIPIGSGVWIEARQGQKQDLSRYRKKNIEPPRPGRPDQTKGKMETV